MLEEKIRPLRLGYIMFLIYLKGGCVRDFTDQVYHDKFFSVRHGGRSFSNITSFCRTFSSILICALQLGQIAKEHGGIMRFIQISCLGASPSSPSRFRRAKAAAEEAVLRELPEVKLFSVLQGRPKLIVPLIVSST